MKIKPATLHGVLENGKCVFPSSPAWKLLLHQVWGEKPPLVTPRPQLFLVDEERWGPAGIPNSGRCHPTWKQHAEGTGAGPG